MPPNIDMIGAQDEEEMQLSIGSGHVIYTGGAKGTDELAEEMAKHFGMQARSHCPTQSSTSRFRQSFLGGSVSPSQSSPLSGCPKTV